MRREAATEMAQALGLVEEAVRGVVERDEVYVVWTAGSAEAKVESVAQVVGEED